MIRTYMTLTPAYGREYITMAQVQADWDANKDFRIETPGYGGTYINKPQVPMPPAGTVVEVRFAKGKRVVEVART